MIEHETEIPLTDGNVNAGVVRIGDTVRRATGVHSDHIHRFLAHLEHAGFAQAPRFLGIDDKGREILSVLPGSTEFPADMWTNEAVIVASAHMLRAYHDASHGFDFGAAEDWAFCYPDAARHEVICHNDFAPYNMVFNQGVPNGIFDFDLIGPGPRLRDLAYLAYWMAPLSYSTGDMADNGKAELARGCPRLKLLCATYGTHAYADLLAMVSEVLHHMGSQAAAVAMIGAEAAGKLREGGHFAHWQAEAVAFDASKANALAALG